MAGAGKPVPRAIYVFCEYADTKPKKTPTWFALDESRPLLAFAAIWTEWSGVRGTKANPVEGRHLLYGFLTAEPNDVVAPIHPKAMPVILTTEEECEVWMRAPWTEACTLQRPLPNGVLKIIASGEREDPPPERAQRGATAVAATLIAEDQPAGDRPRYAAFRCCSGADLGVSRGLSNMCAATSQFVAHIRKMDA